MELLERIAHWASIIPHQPAHRSGDSVLTYADLATRSDALAAHLAQSLPDNQVPVAVLGHKEPEILIAFLGIIKSGHPYIPLDSSLPQQRIERILSSSGAALTLTPAQVAQLSEGPASPPTRTHQPSDPFYIMFTSGSTGEPKGVVITVECLTHFLRWMQQEQAFKERAEVFLNQAPFSFDLSVMDLYLSLSSGGTLYSITRDDIANPRQLYQALRVSNLTTWVSTPSFAQLCLVERTFDEAMLPRLRRFLFCGETLANEIAARLLDRFPSAQVWNTYGPTEATVATTSIRVDRHIAATYAPLPVGFPMPGTRIAIRDEAGNFGASSARGEIIIAGPNVSVGYYGQPELTKCSFFMLEGKRAYSTGDSGHFKDGMLFFEGRIDNQIKLHGYRVELGDIEANIQALPGVRDAVVLPVLKQNVPDSLTAFVILDQPASDTKEVAKRLRSQLLERLPAYMAPRKFVFLDTFPMTTNGKANRRKLAETLT